MTLTKEQLDELEKLEQAATPGPWVQVIDGKLNTGNKTYEFGDPYLSGMESVCDSADYIFAAKLRNHSRELIQAAQENQQLRALLREVEYVDFTCGEYFAECPVCMESKENGGHAPDCRLAKAIEGGG